MLALLALTRCDENNPAPKQEEKELTLSVTPDSQSDVSTGSTAFVKITSGNGDYKIELSDASKVDVQLSDDKKTLMITGKTPGDTQITVIDVRTGKRKTFRIRVTKSIVSVTGVTLTPSAKELKTGETFTLTATVTPSEADNKQLTWTSSNAQVASVDANGKVSALQAGTAIITVRTVDGGKTATCALAIIRNLVPVTGVTLAPSAKELKTGETFTLTATVTPSEADNKQLTWTSSNAQVATVDANGKVSALQAGTAIITVRTVDGGKTATCAIAVAQTNTPTPPTPPVPPTPPTPNPPAPPAHVRLKGIGIKPTAIPGYMTPGQTYQLTARYDPENATNKKVTWHSRNPRIATVDANGLVTAVGQGNTRIIITADDGGHEAGCYVYVNKGTTPPTPPPTPPTPPPTPPTPPAPSVIPVTGVSVEPTQVALFIESPDSPLPTTQLRATVRPSNATQKKVTWTSNDASVASVDSNGKVTGRKQGKAVITVTTVDGSKTATCVVTVATIIN